MKKVDWQIIRKVLDHVATDAEQAEYRRWLEATPGHRSYMEQIKRFDGHSPDLPVDKLQWNFQEFSRLLARRRQKRLIIRWSSVAALFILTFGIGLLLLQDHSVPTSGFVNSLASNTDFVTVTLPDGRKYNLEDKSCSIERKETGLPKETQSENVPFRIIDVPRGKNWSFTLADSTKVYINANSRIIFPENFDGQSERRITLAYGEAYFQVQRDTNKPFIVTAGQIETRVYGTEFNVNAYSPETPYTTLISGSVSMQQNGKTAKVYLLPGQQGYPGIQGKLVVENADIELITAWKEDLFLFKNTTLEEIAGRLKDWYRVEFYFSREELRKERFYCRMPRSSSLHTILEALGRIDVVQFSYQDGVVTVY